MADSNIIIKIRGDTVEFVSDISKANKSLDSLTSTTSRTNQELARSQSVMSQFGKAMSDTTVYGGAFMLINTLAAIPSKVYEVGNAFEGLDAAYLAIFGSQQTANQQLEYTRQLANKLGVNVLDLSNGYKNWAASAENTVLAGRQQQEIFEAVASASRVLNLSADDTTGTLKALGQMLSKGKVQAEELRGQLGERIPDAFGLAARAMGVTTAQLDKMMQNGQVLAVDLLPKLAVELQKTYGGEALAKAMQSTSAQVANLKNELIELGADGFSAIAPALNVSIIGLKSLVENQDAVINATGLLSAALVGKGVSALESYTAAKIQAAQAAKAQAAAEAMATVQSTESALAQARASAMVAESTVVETAATVARTRARVNDAVLQLEAARGTQLEATAIARLNTARIALAESENVAAAARLRLIESNSALIASENALAASQSRLTATTVASTSAIAGLRAGAASLLGMMGGVAGVLTIAAGAAFIFREEIMEVISYTGQARKSTSDHSEAMITAKEAAYQYATASKELRFELDKQRESSLDAARASVEDAKASLAAAEAKLNSIKQLASGGDGAVLSGFGSTDSEERELAAARKFLQQQKDELAQLEKGYATFGKTKEEVDKTFAALENDKQQAIDKTTTAITQNTTAIKTAIAIDREHGDALKSAIEGLEQKNIAIQYGQRLADYYRDSLGKLTQEEVRFKLAAEQSSDILAERKRLERESEGIGAGLRSKYKLELQDKGLTPDALDFDKVQPFVTRAINLQDTYISRIEATEAAIKRMTDAAKEAGNTTTASIEKTVASGAKATDELIEGIRKNAQAHNQSIAAIDKVAKETGTDPVLMKSMAWVESGFNAKASNPSGADGLYQFVNSTGKQYGLSGQEFDPEANTRAYVKLLQDNMEQLKRYGIQINAANLYLAHQQGVGGLKQIMDEANGNGEMSFNVRRNMMNNQAPDTKANTAQEFLENWQAHYAKIEDGVKQVFGGVSSVVKVTGEASDQTKLHAMAVDAVVVNANKANVATDTNKKLTTQQADILKQVGITTANNNKITVDYGGTLAQVQQTTSEIPLDVLYMDNQTKQLVKSAQAHRAEITMSAEEYAAWKLTQDEFTTNQIKVIQGEEQLNNLLSARKDIANDVYQATHGKRDNYAYALKQDKNISESGRETLSSAYMTGEYQKQLDQNELRLQQLKSTGLAYLELTNKRDGYNDAERRGLLLSEQAFDLESKRIQISDDLYQATHGKRDNFVRDLKGTSLNDRQKEQLANEYMQAEHDKEIDQLKLSTAQVAMNGEAYLNHMLKREKYNEKLQQSIVLGNQELDLAKAKQQIESSTYQATHGERDNYIYGLRDTTLNPQQKNNLASQYMTGKFDAEMEQQRQKRQELSLSTEEYRKVTLARDQYSESQINGLVAGEEEIRRLTLARKTADDLSNVFSNGVTGAMQNMLHTGNSIMDAMIDKLIETLIAGKEVQALFNSFGSGVGNLFSTATGNSATVNTAGGDGLMSSISSFFGFKDGGSFANGAQKFAVGGAFGASLLSTPVALYASGDAFHNTVLNQTMPFIANKRLAVAGEAGPEAVMPLVNGAVKALVTANGKESVTSFPLTRINGSLAVKADFTEAFAQGAAFGSYSASSSGVPSSLLSANKQPMQPVINISIDHSKDTTVTESRTQRADGALDIKFIVRAVKNDLMQEAADGGGLARIFQTKN